MGSIVDDAAAIAAQLRPDVVATHDPAKAAASLPCVLVTPPTIDYRARTNTWRVVCLASDSIGSLHAVDQLDELLAVVVDRLHVDRAEPATYVVTPDTGAVPAYVCYVTT